MHIVLTANYSPWSEYCGGGQRFTHDLASALKQRGHDVDVVFTKPPWEHVEVPRELPYRVYWASLPAVRSHRAASLRPLAAISVAWVVSRLLLPSGETVVHCQGEEGALLPLLRRWRPFLFVVTPHYPHYPDALTQKSGWVKRFGLLLFKAPKFLLLGAALRGAARCFPPSSYAAEQVRRAYSQAAPMEVVPNGVSDVFLRGGSHEEQEAERTLLFFGRIARAKGVYTLVDAVAQLADEPSLHIVGRGPEEGALAEYASAMGLTRVCFHGWSEAEVLKQWLQKCTVAVLPSQEESFGNAMAEAMAAEVPVVSTTAGSIPEVVKHGETGLLVPPDDPQKLACAIRHVLENPAQAKRLGAAGRCRVREHFTWEAVARRFEGIYTRLLREAQSDSKEVNQAGGSTERRRARVYANRSALIREAGGTVGTEA